MTLGEQMLRQGTATLTQGVFLPQQNNIKGFILSPGFYPKSGEEKGRIFTGFDTRNNGFETGYVSLDNGLFGQVVLPRAIRFDREKQETCVMAPNLYGIVQPVCDTEFPYQFTEKPFRSANDFQQTLIYSGRVGDKIKISYREFSNSMARDAFTNDAEYDLSASNVIAYKGAKLEVVEADNEKIRYRVISNFNLSN
ncbi:hypothetical protein [Erythrobacter sp. R86502]|uniref:hypothetical protein n=1 Tax=Erythrobacter sp. R86502 TaxID=3093846 RepID=UPI0036D2B500